MRTLQRIIRQVLRRQGVEIGRYHWPRLLKSVHPDVVFDIGANVGQYAGELRAAGYDGRVVSFEPQSAAHAELVRNSASDPNWTIAPRAALGENPGKAVINIAGNSFSSSLMNMGELHRDAAPEARYVGTEEVEVHRLDSLAPQFLHPGERLMLKIDVQGFEQQVMAGAPETLARAVALQFEASLVPLYEGEAPLSVLIERAQAAGFELWNLAPGFADTRTGRLLQVDCLFVRK